MSIVVTGALGQLGSELCRGLGSRAVPLDLPEFDLTDRDATLARLSELKPDAIINAAAYTNVDGAQSDPDVPRAVNATAVAHLVEACDALGCPLLHVSTDYVFGGDAARQTPYSEYDPPAPQGVYAQTKREGEQIAATLTKHLVVRTCGLYERPTMGRRNNFPAKILELARSRPKLSIVDDQHCAPSYVPHVAAAIRFLIGADGGQPAAWGTYHVTNRGATTWHGFAVELLRRAGVDVKIETMTTAEFGAPAPRPAYSLLDTAKYHALGGPVMPTWQEAVAEYVAELSEASSR